MFNRMAESQFQDIFGQGVPAILIIHEYNENQREIKLF